MSSFLQYSLGISFVFFASGLFAAAKPVELLNNLPLRFQENRGQTDPTVRFTTQSRGAKLFVTDDGVTFAMGTGVERSALRFSVAGSDGASKVTGEREFAGVANYLRGSDASKWVTGARHFGAVRATGVKPGIDLLYYGHGQELEYDVVLRPGANAGDLRFRFEGAEKLSLTAAGDLLVHTAAGDLTQHKPMVWQETDGKRTLVSAAYRLAGKDAVEIRLGEYDSSRELMIDPVLSFATYLGGKADDSANAVALDSSGNIYIAGVTNSTDFPTSIGAYRVALNGSNNDAFVTKLNPAGTAILYSTFLGGSYSDVATSIAVDANGNAYIFGNTQSIDFPTTAGSLAPTRINAGMFVSKLNANGTALVYSTYLGGGYNSDNAAGIAIDTSGSAYVTGSTYGNFPVTVGSYSPNNKHGNPNSYGSDAFIAKLTATGNGLVYGTYLGGTSYDSGVAIALDSSGQAYVTGTTNSTDFPVSANAFQQTTPLTNNLYYTTGFVACLNSAGTALTYSTYLGGSNTTSPAAIALDASQNAYVGGVTSATDFPTTAGSFSTSLTSYSHGFVSKLNYVGTALLYSSLLGGSGGDALHTLAVDSSGSAIVTGFTNSTDFPVTPGAFPLAPTADYPNQGMFLTKFNASGTSVLYSTYFGPAGTSVDHGIALDSLGNPIIVGSTVSKTLPTPVGSLQRTNPDVGTLQTGTGFATKVNLSSSTMCSLSLSTVTIAVPLSGSTGTVTVTVPNGCPWEATTPSYYYNQSFVTLTGSSGVGAGSFSYSVPANASTSTPRSATIRVGTSTIALTQPGGSCNTPLLNPSSYGFDSSGGLSSITVQIPSGCNYTPTASAPWIQFSSSATLNGSTTIYYFVTRNDFSTRFGAINIAGTLFNVSQIGAGCVGTLTAGAASFGAQGGTGVIPFSVAPLTCQWTAATLVPWITVNTAAGTGSGFDGFNVLSNPGIASRSGQILIAGQLFTVSQGGGGSTNVSSYNVTTIAGTGGYGFSGDGGAASTAALAYPQSAVFDPAGNLFIADGSNYRVRKVTTAGTISTVAGNGGSIETGDGGLATSASIFAPSLLAVDSVGNLLISGSSSRIRGVSPAGIITTVAGTGSVGNPADGSPANSPIPVVFSMAADGSGNLFFSDGSTRVRRLAGGSLYFYAGTGVAGNNGDGLAATATTLASPKALGTDSAGNLYIAETGRIRKIQGGKAVTVAGGGSGVDAENIPATSIAVNASALAADPQGNLLYIDGGGRIRRVTSDGKVATIAGSNSSFGFSGDGGPALLARFNTPTSLSVDQAGNIAVADFYNQRVRLLTPVYSACTYNLSGNNMQISGTGGTATITVTTTSSCAWNGMSNVPWITVTNAGTGTGAATLSYTPNGTTARTGTVYLAGQLVTVSQAAGSGVITISATKVGVFQPGAATWILDANGSGVYDAGDRNFSFLADPGDIAVVGDWTGDGKAKVGVYRNGFWILDLNNNGVWDGPGVDRFIGLGGLPGDVPVVGDWNGDGRTKVGIYRNGFWLLDTNGNGQWDGPAGGDQFIGFGGNAGEQPVVGDWNGDGRTKVGFLYNGTWVLDYNGNGVYDFADKIYTFPYAAGDRAVVGDWNGSRTTKIGVYRGGFWILDYNGNGVWDGVAGGDQFSGFGGNAGEVPVVGDWNANGKTKIGIFVRGFWILDYNGNGQYDGTGPGQDRFIAFGGVTGEQPIVGAW